MKLECAPYFPQIYRCARIFHFQIRLIPADFQSFVCEVATGRTSLVPFLQNIHQAIRHFIKKNKTKLTARNCYSNELYELFYSVAYFPCKIELILADETLILVMTPVRCCRAQSPCVGMGNVAFYSELALSSNGVFGD